MDTKGKLVITKRELEEIRLSLYYERSCFHGTSGHLAYMLIAKFAKHNGFDLDSDQYTVQMPKNAVVVP